MPTLLKLATRQSQLALWQANFVKAQLQSLNPSVQVELVPLVTEGDKITDRPLAEFGGKGLFIKRLEQALLKKEADFAVHSMKDVPPKLEADFCIPAILQRVSPFDVFVSNKYHSLKELPPGALVGTSSVRRIAQLKHFRPDLQTQPIRGNVDTRLKKLNDEVCDALILAEAGLQRLGLANHIREVLPANLFLPSVGQGALGVECLTTNESVIEILKMLNHTDTMHCVQAERSLTAQLGAHCNSPVGSYAYIEQGLITLQAEVLNQEGSTKIIAGAQGKLTNELGVQVAKLLLDQGAASLF